MAGKLKGAMPAHTPKGVLRVEMGGLLPVPKIENSCSPVAGEVHVLAHPDQVLPDQQVGHAASLLNHLTESGILQIYSSENIDRLDFPKTLHF